MNAIHTPPAQRVFRHAGAALIDTPDLANPPRRATDRYRWVATMWPEPTEPDHWAALEWTVAPRGWWLPATLAIGDIIEFGVTWNVSRQRQHTDRWFGWLECATPLALIINGPYPHPELALVDARPVVDEIRLAQLAPPGHDHLVAARPETWDR